MFFYDWTLIILIPGIIIAAWAQSRVSHNFNKYSKVYSSKGYTASQVARILLDYNGLQNINIEIVGCWIWVDGNTYEHKDTLKALGFKWAREKKKWYFHTESFRKRSHKKLSMDDIRNYYGSTEVQTEEVKRIKEA